MITYPLWTLGEVAQRIVRPKELTPRENTQRCYEELFDPLCGQTGVWANYTEGYYPKGNETYEEAQLKKFDFFLDQCECGSETRYLDIGCGNGALLQRAVERGAEGSGITIVPTQVESCQQQGLDVILCSYDEVRQNFEPHQFDVITLNSPTEHFVTELDALEGRAEAVWGKMFEMFKYLLKPGGRLFIACIHFREFTDVGEVLKPPMSHPLKSYNFYCSLLIKIYSGWYPYEDSYPTIAQKLGFKLTFEHNATQDYMLTSYAWAKKLRFFMLKHIGFVTKFFFNLFLKDPQYCFYTFLYGYYGAWGWQFKGGEHSPMIHKWLMFKLESDG